MQYHLKNQELFKQNFNLVHCYYIFNVISTWSYTFQSLRALQFLAQNFYLVNFLNDILNIWERHCHHGQSKVVACKQYLSQCQVQVPTHHPNPTSSPLQVSGSENLSVWTQTSSSQTQAQETTTQRSRFQIFQIPCNPYIASPNPPVTNL